MSGPAGIYLHVTRRCTLACVYCYGACSPQTGGDLDEALVAHLAEEVRRLAPKRLTVTGGEPLLHPRLLEIASTLRAACHDVGCCLRLATNGLLLDASWAARLRELFDEVRVSLDGPREINDVLRGIGSHDGATSALRKLLGAGIRPSISVTASQWGLPGLPAFLRYLQTELGIAQIHVSPLRPAGRALERPDLACSWRQVNAVVGEYCSHDLVSLEQVQVDGDGEAALLECGACGIGDYLSIEADGGIYPCHVLTRPEFRLGSLPESLDRAARSAHLLGQQLAARLTPSALDGRDASPLHATGSSATCLGELLPLPAAL